MMLDFGTIYWVDLSRATGKEQSGRRPVIIWQNPKDSSVLPTVIGIPRTSQLRTLRYIRTVRVEPTASNGLTLTSVALVFQLQVIDATRLEERIGTLDDQYQIMIAKELESLLNLTQS